MSCAVAFVHRAGGAPRRVRALFLGLLVGTVLVLPLAAGSDPESPEPTLRSLMQGMASTSGVVARFREVKELALLSTPLVTEGTLYFAPPDRLARVTTTPSRSLLIIDGDRFVYRDEAGADSVDISSNPFVREFVDSFIVLFNGDLEALRKRYDPTFQVGRSGRWSLTLQPKGRPLSGFVERITLEGTQRVLRRIELVESDGDRTRTVLENVRLDQSFDSDALEETFAGPSEGS